MTASPQAPDCRASLKAIAMACLRFVTLRPLPDLRDPVLYSCMTFSTLESAADFFAGILPPSRLRRFREQFTCRNHSPGSEAAAGGDCEKTAADRQQACGLRRRGGLKGCEAIPHARGRKSREGAPRSKTIALSAWIVTFPDVMGMQKGITMRLQGVESKKKLPDSLIDWAVNPVMMTA